MKNIEVRQKMAKEFIEEFGGQKKIVKELGNVSQPGVSVWQKKGLPARREEFLRLRYPYMEVWKNYRPLEGLCNTVTE